MSITHFDSSNKRKRNQIIYNFHTFGEDGCPFNPVEMAAFRDNITLFLNQCTEFQDYEVDGKPVRCTLLVIESKYIVLPLYAIEEDVTSSMQPYCVHCRCTGWSANFVSKRKYHLIIPTESDWNRRLEDGALDLQSHLLHGLVHCNGFGHLLCLNGIEGGSKHLCGREIMDLWDRICRNLRVRKISVEDGSKKQSLDLRLLYGVAYGHSWFGRWGYKFQRGSFGVTEENYKDAVDILSSIELDYIIQEFNGDNQYREIKKIVSYYRDLSKTQLNTIREVLSFMLTLMSCPCTRSQLKKQYQLPAASYSVIKVSSSKPKGKVGLKKQLVKEKGTTYKTLGSLVSGLDSRWHRRRLEYAAEVIVNAMKEKQQLDKFHQGSMTRQDVRDAARMHIGDTGLIDYVMKSLNNVIVGEYVVHRVVNPRTRILEYSLQLLSDAFQPVKSAEISEDTDADHATSSTFIPGMDVCCDMAYLYTTVLWNSPESETIKAAIQVILDSKHFVKEWPVCSDQQTLTFICQVAPNFIDPEPTQIRKSTPGEIVFVPLYTTLKDLKQAAQDALRDTYCILDKFVVTEIKDMEEFGEEELLFGSVESGTELLLRGYDIDNSSQLRYEGGPETWKVSCECGVDDDDGERMVACDICEVWHHTRCIGIEDSETVPPLFICQACCWDMKPCDEPNLESVDLLMLPSIEYGADLMY